MTSERWKLVEELFERALELPAAGQGAWLAANCADPELRAEVEQLLQADNNDGAIEDPIGKAVGQLTERVRKRDVMGPGTVIGSYELLGEVGRGGMGTVFRARRVDGVFDKEVAIKVVNSRGAMASHITARFRRERNILARLDHPNIARVLDGGSTPEGVPYLVMEYVQGEPLSAYAAEHRLDIEARLTLFLQVCSAVQYAHQHMVVHRDLKPSNILVDETGQARLLDFGIAKLLADTEGMTLLTVDAMRPLTPQYGSPEQVRGEEITAASDIYSLGALLFELLTGRTAFQSAGSSPVNYAYAVCDTDPPAPSRSVRDGFPVKPMDLQGDLDQIVLHALSRDPRHRYATVDQFAEDIRRYQSHLPVRASSQTGLYRALKFVRRNRTPVLTGVLVCASLLAGFVTALHQARRAERRAAQLRHLTNTFIFDVHDAVEHLPGATEARRLILAKAVEQLEILRKEADDPASRFELGVGFRKIGNAIGGVQVANLGDRGQAGKYYAAARELMESVVRDQPRNVEARIELAETLRSTGALSLYNGDRAAAAEELERAILVLGDVEGYSASSAMAASILLEISDLDRATGKTAKALQDSERAVRVMEAVVAADPKPKWQLDLASAWASVSKSCQRSGDLNRSIEAARKNTQILARHFEANRLDRGLTQKLMLAHGHEGDILGWPGQPNLGDRAGAEQAYRKAVELAEKLASADSKDTRARLDLAISLTRLANVIAPDRNRDALDTYQRALAIFEELSLRDPGNAVALSNMAYLLRMAGKRREDAGDFTGALESLRRCQTVTRSVLDRKPAEVVHMRVFHLALEDEALLLRKMGREQQARAVVDRFTADVERPLPGRDPFNLTLGRARAARLRAGLSQAADSCEHHKESLRWFESIQSNRGFVGSLPAELKAAEQAVARCR